VSRALIGLVAALGSALVFSLGVAVQALEARASPGRVRALRLLSLLARRRAWLVGTTLTLVAWVLQIVALLFAPLTLVQPALATQVIVLLLIGRRVLREQPSSGETVATLAIALGLAGTAWAAPERMAHHAHGASLLLPVAVLGLVTLIPQLRRDASPAGARISALCAGAAYGWTGIASKLAADDLAHHDWLALAAWVAGIATIAVVGTGNEMSALQVRPATAVVPIVLALEVLVPVILAPLVAEEGWRHTQGSGLVLLASIGLVAAGAIRIASGQTMRVVLPVGPGSMRSHRFLK
jgi:drug/metabolite transporter (DMT)-like permease